MFEILETYLLIIENLATMEIMATKIMNLTNANIVNDKF